MMTRTTRRPGERSRSARRRPGRCPRAVAVGVCLSLLIRATPAEARDEPFKLGLAAAAVGSVTALLSVSIGIYNAALDHPVRRTAISNMTLAMVASTLGKFAAIAIIKFRPSHTNSPLVSLFGTAVGGTIIALSTVGFWFNFIVASNTSSQSEKHGSTLMVLPAAARATTGALAPGAALHLAW